MELYVIAYTCNGKSNHNTRKSNVQEAYSSEKDCPGLSMEAIVVISFGNPVTNQKGETDNPR